MRCEKCGHDNPDDNRFCGACGGPLVELLPDERILRALKLKEQGEFKAFRKAMREIPPDDCWYQVAQCLLGDRLYHESPVGQLTRSERSQRFSEASARRMPFFASAKGTSARSATSTSRAISSLCFWP